jgi:hypothetical protein
MIVTREQDKLAGRAFRTGPGMQMWRRAHIELFIPYFFLSYDIADGGSWVGHTELYWEIDQLLHCCSEFEGTDQLRLNQIALISPSWMNHQDGWQMDTVREVWRGYGEGGQAVTQYVCDAGRRLTDCHEDTVAASMVKLLTFEKTGLVVVKKG